MQVELSFSKALRNWGKERVSSIVLYFLYGGLYELYHTDPGIKAEVDQWPDGMTYVVKCSPKGPGLIIRKNEGKLMRLNPRIQRSYDTCITFKNIDSAFLVLTGRQGIAGAYAAHAFSLHGDIGTAMEFVRCVDIVESYLFPKVMTKRILKEVAPKNSSSLVLYAKILINGFRGAYNMANDEKKPYREKAYYR